MKLFFLVFYFLFLVQNSFSQSFDKRNQSVRSLNLYIHYCNETIHGMWMLFRNLESFNGSLLHKYGKTISEKDYFPVFRNDSVFHNTSYYKDAKIPQKIYEECLQASVALEPQDRENLNAKLTQLKSIVDNWMLQGASLENYCINKTYLRDENFTKAFEILTKYEMSFLLYDNLKDSLFAEIRQIYKIKYPPSQDQKPIVLIAKQMEEAIFIYKNIMDDLGKGDTSLFLDRKSLIKPLIDSLEAQMEEKIKNLYRFGRNNGLDVGWRYENVVGGLKSMYQNQETFLRTNWNKKLNQISTAEKTSKCLYFYNTIFTNKYNRFGLGLISKYNKFIDLADGKSIQREAQIPDSYMKSKAISLDASVNVLLHWVEEPHLYKVVYPEKPEPANQETSNTENKDIPIDFYQLEVGKVVNLKNIIFRLSEAVLLPSSYIELNNLLQFMQDSPKVKILLEGHTDYFGNPKGNMKLSKKRVEVIKSYLLSKGISGKRVQLKWYGGTRPIVRGDTEEERKANRRVECIILEK